MATHRHLNSPQVPRVPRVGTRFLSSTTSEVHLYINRKYAWQRVARVALMVKTDDSTLTQSYYAINNGRMYSGSQQPKANPLRVILASLRPGLSSASVGTPAEKRDPPPLGPKANPLRVILASLRPGLSSASVGTPAEKRDPPPLGPKAEFSRLCAPVFLRRPWGANPPPRLDRK